MKLCTLLGKNKYKLLWIILIKSQLTALSPSANDDFYPQEEYLLEEFFHTTTSLMPQNYLEERILETWFGGAQEGRQFHDYTLIQGLYSEDAVIHGREKVYRGPEGIVELMQMWHKALPQGFARESA